MGFLNKIITPKWKNKNAKVRIEAFQKLNNQDILIDIAKNDNNINILRKTMNKINNKKILEDIAKKNYNNFVYGDYTKKNCTISVMMQIKKITKKLKILIMSTLLYI